MSRNPSAIESQRAAFAVALSEIRLAAVAADELPEHLRDAEYRTMEAGRLALDALNLPRATFRLPSPGNPRGCTVSAIVSRETLNALADKIERAANLWGGVRPKPQTGKARNLTGYAAARSAFAEFHYSKAVRALGDRLFFAAAADPYILPLCVTLEHSAEGEDYVCAWTVFGRTRELQLIHKRTGLRMRPADCSRKYTSETELVAAVESSGAFAKVLAIVSEKPTLDQSAELARFLAADQIETREPEAIAEPVESVTPAASCAQESSTAAAPDESAKPAAPNPARVAKPVTPQVASARLLASFIGIAADSVDRLRASDVERVIREAPAHYRLYLAGYIKANRYELSAAVDEAMDESEPAQAPETDESEQGDCATIAAPVVAQASAGNIVSATLGRIASAPAVPAAQPAHTKTRARWNGSAWVQSATPTGPAESANRAGPSEPEPPENPPAAPVNLEPPQDLAGCAPKPRYRWSPYSKSWLPACPAAKQLGAISVRPYRYAKNSVVALVTSNDGYKSRAAWLAEALGGRHSHRAHGYVMRPARAERLRHLHATGWDCDYNGALIPPPGWRGKPPSRVKLAATATH